MIQAIVSVSAGLLTFGILTAMALPHLETGLTFLPIVVISVVVGFFALKVCTKFKKFD